MPAQSKPAVVQSKPAVVPEHASPAAPVVDLPGVELNSRILFQYLVSEIAAQRGDGDLAAEGMLDLARTTQDPRLAKRATELAIQSRREPQALEASSLWMKLNPAEVSARQARAALLINGGRLEEAKPLLKQLLADEGANVGRALMHLNQLLARQQDKAAALALIQDLTKPYLDNADAHFAIAHAAWGAGKDELALEEARAVIRLRPEWEAAYQFQGQLMQRASAPKALEFYRDTLARQPRMQDVRLAYARLLVSERQYAEARAQFEKLLGDLPGNAEVNLAVGVLAMQLKDYDAAEQHLKQALAAQPRDEAAVRAYLGQLAEERGRYEEAAGWYVSIKPGGQYLAAQVRYAAMLAKQGKLPEARAHLGQVAVQDDQQRVQLIIAESQLLRDAKAYAESYDLLGKALEKLPDSPDLLYDHAMAAERIGKIDVLERDLRKLIQLKPDYAHAYNALGYTLADHSERLDEALALVQKAIELSPDDHFIMDSLGWVLFRMGQLDQAEAMLRRAYAGQQDAEIAAHLGEVLWTKGKSEEAEKIWQSALEAHPQHEVLLNVIKKFAK